MTIVGSYEYLAFNHSYLCQLDRQRKKKGLWLPSTVMREETFVDEDKGDDDDGADDVVMMIMAALWVNI